MATSEYAMALLAAVAFAGVLYKIVTGARWRPPCSRRWRRPSMRRSDGVEWPGRGPVRRWAPATAGRAPGRRCPAGRYRSAQGRAARGGDR
ncbi:DUF4244 domain-containing protein [Streptomyces sp. S399]|uniref:DUF4244 domain-containing protein n=1 Tax=Streptomyces sp. S399 TaxID=3096009 RepID=UPI0039C38DA1